jgi:hypothetical protein
MNDLIINETNVGDISAEIIASLMNLHILPHDVPQETFDKWMGVVERTLRHEEQHTREQIMTRTEQLNDVIERCETWDMPRSYSWSGEIKTLLNYIYYLEEQNKLLSQVIEE